MSPQSRLIRWLSGGGDDASTEEESGGAQRSLRSTTQSPVENNAGNYGVTIEEAKVAPGADYWRVTRVYHLAPQENNGRHHIFLDGLSPDGVRINTSQARITWDGGEQVVTLDKPDNEPGANFPMWKWQVCSVEMIGLPSDKVHGLRTNHPDEPNPGGGGSGNTLFHHSFLIVYQQAKAPERAGTILGRVENTRAGLVVTLLRGDDAIDNATVDTSGGFTFTNVKAGAYSLRLEGVTQPVQVTAGQTAQVTVTLPPRNSIIEGTVTNGTGLLLRLVSQGEVLAQGALGQSGTFRLRNLGAATYFVQVVRPGQVDPVVQSEALTLDGNNQRRIDLTVPEEKPAAEGVIKRYVLLGAVDKATTKAHLTVLVSALAEKRVAFGFDVHEAANAQEVTVIGDGEAVPEGSLIYLSMRGVKVQRLTGTPEEIRAQLDAVS